MSLPGCDLRHGLALTISIAALSLAAADATADPKSPKPYGHYNQNATEFNDICSKDNVSHACGPISFLNSLVFLQNTYPQFGNTLVGADPHATAKTIADLMGCKACSGTDIDKFFAGKKAYFDTIPSAKDKISTVKFTSPTVAQLSKEIDDREDVEMFLGFYGADGKQLDDGHYVTLYDINDTKISFIDPGGLAGADGGKIDGATEEVITFSFSDTLKKIVLSGYEGLPAGAEARVDFAFAESPIPEPQTWLMMTVALGLVGATLRRRRVALAG